MKKIKRPFKINLPLSEGAHICITALLDECGYKTQSDVIHDAIRELSMKKLNLQKFNYHIKNII